MPAAFTYKAYLLHDQQKHKKIQPEGKESRPEVGRFVFGKPSQLKSVMEGWKKRWDFAYDTVKYGG